ncbi:phosphotransferase [Olsenella sp. Marseille-P4559]|uniref:phosphotransferase n=1 Tax=Olsenella sp. Marseille-P4559 TaxID=2364795 RepID=UPI0010324A0F|nr:phosphotransferase [Olsenella sp. Marseille-P4559]
MALTRKEFDVLSSLATRGDGDRAEPSEFAGLRTSGLVMDNGLTDLGRMALEPYRVDNAIIMAAGLSSRFVPVSYERPKGLTSVRGEVLIERQIRQLHEAGITNITVVVGYRAGEFSYLEGKFGVRLVTNDLYAERNNNWTLWLVRSQLSNTYVCSSDDYFMQNPFEPYVYKAYYAAVYVDGPTDEWCLGTNEDGRIVSVDVGGSDAWVMLGHVYFDQAFSAAFVDILGKVVSDPPYGKAHAGDLWEAIFASHLDELDMEIRHYPEGMVQEFDSLDELAAFDPEFLDTVTCQPLDDVALALGCDRSDLHDFYPVTKGLTNQSFHFSVGKREYIYRRPGRGTEKFINRKAETDADTVARNLGIDRTFICEDPERGWKLSHFVADARSVDPFNPDEVARAMALARQIHESGASIDTSFDFFADGLGYERLLLEHGPIAIPGYHGLREKIVRLNALSSADEGFPTCFCHNDYLPLNFLIGKDGSMNVIDWEFAGMGDPGNDTATFIICSQYDEAQANAAIDAYFGRPATFGERRHFWARVVLGGWCWYVWALEKDAEGAGVGEWLDIYKSYATTYIDEVLSWYERDDASKAGRGAARRASDGIAADNR